MSTVGFNPVQQNTAVSAQTGNHKNSLDTLKYVYGIAPKGVSSFIMNNIDNPAVHAIVTAALSSGTSLLPSKGKAVKYLAGAAAAGAAGYAAYRYLNSGKSEPKALPAPTDTRPLTEMRTEEAQLIEQMERIRTDNFPPPEKDEALEAAKLTPQNALYVDRNLDGLNPWITVDGQKYAIVVISDGDEMKSEEELLTNNLLGNAKQNLPPDIVKAIKFNAKKFLEEFVPENPIPKKKPRKKDKEAEPAPPPKPLPAIVDFHLGEEVNEPIHFSLPGNTEETKPVTDSLSGSWKNLQVLVIQAGKPKPLSKDPFEILERLVDLEEQIDRKMEQVCPGAIVKTKSDDLSLRSIWNQLLENSSFKEASSKLFGKSQPTEKQMLEYLKAKHPDDIYTLVASKNTHSHVLQNLDSITKDDGTLFSEEEKKALRRTLPGELLKIQEALDHLKANIPNEEEQDPILSQIKSLEKNKSLVNTPEIRERLRKMEKKYQELVPRQMKNKDLRAFIEAQIRGIDAVLKKFPSKGPIIEGIESEVEKSYGVLEKLKNFIPTSPEANAKTANPWLQNAIKEMVALDRLLNEHLEEDLSANKEAAAQRDLYVASARENAYKLFENLGHSREEVDQWITREKAEPVE